MTERERAIVFILVVLRTPMMLVSPDRHDAIALAKHHEITVEELLEAAVCRARKS